MLRVFLIAHTNVAEAVDDALIVEDAIGVDEILDGERIGDLRTNVVALAMIDPQTDKHYHVTNKSAKMAIRNTRIKFL